MTEQRNNVEIPNWIHNWNPNGRTKKAMQEKEEIFHSFLQLESWPERNWLTLLIERPAKQNNRSLSQKMGSKILKEKSPKS